jgi:hypothetical protein
VYWTRPMDTANWTKPRTNALNEKQRPADFFLVLLHLEQPRTQIMHTLSPHTQWSQAFCCLWSSLFFQPMVPHLGLQVRFLWGYSCNKTISTTIYSMIP